MATKKTTKVATKKPAEKRPVAKKVAAKTTPKKSVAKNVRPAPRLEDSPAVKKQQKPMFSIFDETAKKFLPVEGAKPVTIPGLEAFQLFIHQTKDGRTWCVSEACSGGRLAVGAKRAVAVQMATEMLNKHGKAGILECVQRSINRTGIAPGFVPPEGVKVSDRSAKEKPKQTFKVTTEDGKEIEVAYDESMRHHLEFRGEISPTGYHSHFGYDGKGDVREAALKLANEFRAAFLKQQAKLNRKNKSAQKAPEVSTRLKSKILAALVDGKKLPRTQAHFDEIAQATGASEADVAATLMTLELAGTVKSLPGKQYRMATADEQNNAAAAKPASGRGRKPDGRCPTGNDIDAQITTGASHPSYTEKNARRGSRSSPLDISAAILKDAAEPLTCKEMVRRMLEGRLWDTGGRTPGATLSASINREIARLGKDARFVRAGRGLYGLRA